MWYVGPHIAAPFLVDENQELKQVANEGPSPRSQSSSSNMPREMRSSSGLSIESYIPEPRASTRSESSTTRPIQPTYPDWGYPLQSKNLRFHDADAQFSYLNCDADIRIFAPPKIKLTETLRVIAELRLYPPRSRVQNYSLEVPQIMTIKSRLLSPDFKIPADASPVRVDNDKFRWEWLISPEKVGDRAISLQFEPEIKLSPAKINDNYIPISVLTAIGLSASEDEWSRIIFAVLGSLITIILSKLFSDKKINQSTHGTAASKPTTTTSASNPASSTPPDKPS